MKSQWIEKFSSWIDSFFSGRRRGPAQKRPKSHRAKLGIEALETRANHSVNWSMDGSTLKLVGDDTADWLSVEIADSQVWFNGTGMSGPQSKPASQISAIDIGGRGGGD